MNILKSERPAFDTDKKKILLLMVTLVALNFLLYINTINYDFLKDDFRLIVENPRIKNFQSFINAINSRFFVFPDYPYLHYWRPLSLFSFFVDHQLWGLNPSGYHLFNIVINTFNALLLFLVFYFLLKKIDYAFLGALFFSIHPCHVEAVSWISGRTDLLSCFFIFAAVLFFILFLKKRKGVFYALTVVFFILALLSKENGVFFPLLVVGLIFIVPFNGLTRGARDNRQTDGTYRTYRSYVKRMMLLTLPFWMIDLGYIILHNHFSGVHSVVENFSFKDIFIIIKTIGAYTKIILTPFFPTPHFSMHHFDQNHLEYLLFFAAAAGILAFMLVNREKYKFSLYSLLFFIFLLPLLDPEIVPSYPKIVIRFAYISVLFTGIFFVDTSKFFKDKRLKSLYIGCLVLVALIWVYESVRFQVYFKDQYHHYNDYDGLTRYYPEDCSLLMPLALLNAQDRDYKKALQVVNHALAVSHKDPWLDVSETGGLLKANLLVISGEHEEGRTLAEKILAETRKDEMKYFGHLVLSKYHEKRGDLPTALSMLKKAEHIGETADLFFRLALIYAKMGKYPQALDYVEKAITLNPTMKNYVEFKRFIQELQNRFPGKRNKLRK